MYYDLEDVHRIQEVLKEEHGIFISESEAIDFWKWRSEEWDSSFLSSGNDSEILEWFQKFIQFVGVEPDEDDENIPEPPPKAGVKVLVKDAEGQPWEVELDPEYHSQLIQDIESQIPEKSEGGSIRYSLEYDPTKVWNVRKKYDQNGDQWNVTYTKEIFHNPDDLSFNRFIYINGNMVELRKETDQP
jgi:hypothetical protein